MALPRNHGTTDASRWGILSGGSRPRGGGSSKGALQVVSSMQKSEQLRRPIGRLRGEP